MANKVSSFESFYLVIDKAVAGGENVVSTYGDGEGMLPLNTLVVGGTVRAYQLTYTGITAKEMGDSFTSTLYAVAADGTIHYYSMTNSIKDKLMSNITSTSTIAEHKTMSVDMLNYGAAAQVRFGYDTENLVNADLTAEQQALGTQEMAPAAATNAVSGSGKALMSDVSLMSKVQLLVTCVYAPSDASAMKFVICNAADGTVLEEIPATVVAGRACQATYSNVGAKQMRQRITITLYEGDTAVSQTLTWSVEGYVAEVRNDATGDADRLALFNAMLIYGDAVAAYMTASGQ